MAKRLSEKEKNEIIKSFSEGISLEELSRRFNFTKLTISRNLKKVLGEDQYEKLKKKSSTTSSSTKFFDLDLNKKNENSLAKTDAAYNEQCLSDLPDQEKKNNSENLEFIELAPLDYEIDTSTQKDISSIPLSKVDFPKEVFMIVNKNVELEIKVLRDFPDWHFLPEDDLNRKTIEIFNDLKIAKRDCSREQKVLKVPNTNVFKITAQILISKGITRIVNDDKLISL